MQYIKELIDALKRVQEDDLDNFAKVIAEAPRVYIAGNGGSMALAIHFAQDLLKFSRVKAYALENPSCITAYTNDVGFVDIFQQQLDILLERNDVVILMSGSGESPNILKAIPMDNLTIAFIGKEKSSLAKRTPIRIEVGTDSVQIAEDVFSAVIHILVNKVRERRNQGE